eukprot:COSAG05_NODE_2724_length_2726_cov_1.567568_2_plen_80_part_00
MRAWPIISARTGRYKLGGYNWAGMQCSCGAWITPALQIHGARVDASHRKQILGVETQVSYLHTPRAWGDTVNRLHAWIL